MNSKSLLLVLSLGLLFACRTAQKAQNPVPEKTPGNLETKISAPTTPAPFITWDKKLIDLGTLKKGETRDMEFVFTNTSGQPIQIDIVDACECTTVDFPRGIIPPGGKGKIPATFDSEKKDESETIPIHLYFKQNDANGNPMIETCKYKFELVK